MALFLGAGHYFITCEGGPAILLWGHFQNLDCFWGVIFRKGSVTWGVILWEVVERNIFLLYKLRNRCIKGIVLIFQKAETTAKD